VITDEQAIANLVFRYAEAIDAGDFEAVGQLFEHGTYRGRAGDEETSASGQAVARLLAKTTRRYDDGTPRTLHVTTNLHVEVDDDRSGATSRCVFVVHQVVAGKLQPIIGGRYRDRFERVDGAWRFADRLILPTLFGDLREHLDITL